MTKLEFDKCAPEEVGLPSGAVSEFFDRLDRHGLCMHSVIIMRHGKICVEGYYAPYSENEMHRLFSVSKTVTAIAIGLLQDEGMLSIDDPICKYFPEYVNEDTHPFILAMTIRNCLMMRTCHATTTYKVNMKEDWVKSFFEVEPTHPAGTVFHYDTSSAHTLCALVEKLAETDILSYINKKIPELDLSDEAHFLKDPFGVSIGGSGLCASSKDFLKVTYFLYKKGQICGRNCLEESYVQDMTSFMTATTVPAPSRFESSGYGYQTWMNELGGFTLYGMGGQMGIVLPQQDMIVVTTGDLQGVGGSIQMLLDSVYEELVPYLVPGQAEVDEWEQEVLENRLATLAIKPPAGEHFTATAMRIFGRHFSFEDNKQGFSEMMLVFDPESEEGTLHYALNGKACQINFGLGHLTQGVFPEYNQKYAAGAAWLDADTFYIKVHVIDEYVGTVHFQMHFENQNTTLFLRKVEESLFSEYQGHVYGSMDKQTS